ncbi:isopeptide-forming domain-containing fimbrial protein [Corynebacterium diphtheriae]|nr:isopeptide-forming domain-containing fimbrial protein [Corynebacterium diphtheriae]
MNKFSRTARSVTFAAIVGLSLGVSAPGMVAQAEGVRIVETANIDFSRKGKITIHKKDITDKDNSRAKNATGDEVDDVVGTGLPGVVFTLQKVKLDLKDPENWSKIPKTVAEAKALGLEEPAITLDPTDEHGDTSKDHLDLGLYVVSEIKAPNGVVTGPDFLVTLPMTDSKGKAWDYDVVVYPKNTKAVATKRVSDANKNQNDVITYTINTPIPTIASGQKISSYVITDDYDESKVSVEKDEDVVVKIEDKIISSDSYTLQRNKDGAGRLEIEFKNSDELNANSGKQVTTTIHAKVKKDVEGEVKNTAGVIFNNPSNENRLITVPTNEVFTYYGNATIVKRDQDEQGKVLQGAEFALYWSADQTCDVTDIKPENQVKGAEGSSLPQDGKFVTDENGKLEIKGLHVTNLEDNDKTVSKQYCLVETKAPAGYVTPNLKDAITPFEIKVEQTDDGNGKIVSHKIIHASKEISNKKNPTPELPMTGGAGVGILAAIGAAIIGAGAWFARRNSAES